MLEASMKKWFITGIVIFLAFITANLMALDLSEPLPIDPDLRWGKLNNGFTYYIKVNRKPEKRAELRLFVKAGSVQEDDDQIGLAHFGEHMAFNGTKHFPKQELLDYLNSIGFGFHGGLNGGTSYDFVTYQLQVPSDDPEATRKGFLILSDWAHAISFDPVEIEKERGVIMEEYRGSLSGWERCYRKVSQAIYEGSRYADRMPIGDPEIIQNCSHEALIRFYRDWYHPANLAIAVVGDFDPAAIEALIREYFEPIPPHKDPRPLGIYPLSTNIEPIACVAADPEMNMTMLNLRWKHPVSVAKTNADIVLELRTNLFTQLLSKRFEERADGEFSPFSEAYAYKNNQGMSFAEFNMIFYTPADSVQSAINYGLDELKRIKAHGFSQTELDRAKRTIIREMENAVAEADKQESRWMVWTYMMHFLRGEPMLSTAQQAEIVQSILDLVTLGDINSVHDELVTDENFVVTLITSERPGIPTITEDTILKTVNQNRQTDLVEYEDVFRDEPLVQKLPDGGKVISEEFFPATGIKLWNLSNGGKVYLKATDFQNDELLLRAYSPGGRSYSTEQDYPHAALAVSYAQDCGLGAFSKTELTKKLADKIAWVNPWISRSGEGFSGSCSPLDVETMFQLIHLYFTAPNFNEQSYYSWLNKRSTFIKDRALDPEACFEDSIAFISRDRHLRASPTDMARLQGLDRNIAERFFRERFANIGDFHWVFVGNFDEAKLKLLCETFLATSLPGARPEKFKDDGMRYRKGKHNTEIRKGMADKAIVRLISYREIPVSKETRHETAMAEILAGEKLRENIREDRSGVYYVYCWGDTEPYPAPVTYANLGMGCSPDRVEELITASLAVMDSLKAGLFDDKYVNTVRQARLKQMELNLKNNDWWVDRIGDQIVKQLPLDAIMEEMDAIQKVSKQDLSKWTAKYLDFDTNCQRFILYPETRKE